MEAKWLIESTLLPEDVEPILSSLRKNNIDYTEINVQDVYTKNHYDWYKSEDCVVFFGTLNSAKHFRKNVTWVPGVIYNQHKYNCTYYYPAIGNLLLNRNYMMLPFGELKRQKELLYDKFGEDRTIFIRPDRGDKIFTGKLFYKEYFDKDIERLGHGNIEPHELVIVGEPINILKEWRFICVNGEIITGSLYKENNLVGSHASYTEEAIETARQVVYYKPDIAWAIDVGLTKDGRYCIVEVGCFSCCGLYACNRDIIVKKVSEAALNEWKEYYEF